MDKKISSSTPSGTSATQLKKSTEKSGSKKSGGTKESEKSGTTKESKKSEDVKSSLKPEKECPPDRLNISPDAVEGRKGPEKEIETSDFYKKLEEVREGVINEPEVKTSSIEKGEVDLNELKEILNKREDKGEKADIKSLFAGTDKEIELGGKAFKKLEDARRRKEDGTELKRDYERHQERREDIHSLWDDTGVGARGRSDEIVGDAGGRKRDKPVADKVPGEFKEKEGGEKPGAFVEAKSEPGGEKKRTKQSGIHKEIRDTNNTKNTSTEEELAFFCNPFGNEKQEHYVPFPNVDTNGDGIAETDTRKLSEAALNLIGQPCDLDPITPDLACIEVPDEAYKACGIEMKDKISEAINNTEFEIDDIAINDLKDKSFDEKKLEFIESMKNQKFSRKSLVELLREKGFKSDEIISLLESVNSEKPLYTCSTPLAEGDELENITARVQNWYQFFADEGLLYSGDEPYQTGDVIFVTGPNGYPEHSAIVTRINPSTGKPGQIVGASFTSDSPQVISYSWEEWVEANHGNTSFEHGGFRPPSE